MKRTTLGGKIHRVTVTEANLEYEGSVTIDEDLLVAANILPGEVVNIWDVTNAARINTYTIAGPRGSGCICVNGAAAHLVHAGDLVIIASYVELDDAEARSWKPSAVFVDAENHITEIRHEEAFRVSCRAEACEVFRGGSEPPVSGPAGDNVGRETRTRRYSPSRKLQQTRPC